MTETASILPFNSSGSGCQLYPLDATVATVTIFYCSFSFITSSTDGGAISFNYEGNSSVSIIQSVFFRVMTANVITPTHYGGVLYLDSSTSLTIDGTCIVECKSHKGRCVYVSKACPAFHLDTDTFTRCLSHLTMGDTNLWGCISMNSGVLQLNGPSRWSSLNFTQMKGIGFDNTHCFLFYFMAHERN